MQKFTVQIDTSNGFQPESILALGMIIHKYKEVDLFDLKNKQVSPDCIIGQDYAGPDSIWQNDGLNSCFQNQDIADEVLKQIKTFDVAFMSNLFIPSWLEKNELTSEEKNGLMLEAAGIVASFIKRAIVFANAKIQEQYVVAKGELKNNGETLLLHREIPWSESIPSSVKFIVYPKHQTWVGDARDVSFIPENWHDISGYRLEELTGVKNTNCCYDNCVAGSTKEAVLELVTLALKNK